MRTYALDDGHEVDGVRLGESTGRVHLVDKERDVIRAEFLDKKVREKVIVARKVMHVHHFGGAPFGSD